MTQPTDQIGRFSTLSDVPPEPREPRRWWLLAGAIAVLVLIMAVLIWPDADGRPDPTRDPQGSGDVGPTTPATSAAPSGPLTEQEIRAQIDEVVRSVPAIRGLEPREEVPYTFITREEFQAELEEMFQQQLAPEDLAASERLLKRLGLLPDDASLTDLTLDLYGSQVAAFYRIDTGQFSLIERTEPFGPLDRMIVAHEYTHALQDQQFDLAGHQVTDPAEEDQALARLALTEGDASLVMQQWAIQNLSPGELLELVQSSFTGAEQEVLEQMPPILRRQLEFPYLDGLMFVSQLYADGGWEAVDDAFADPPASSEQILHPEKYLEREPPIEVELPDLAGPDGLGEGWDAVSTSVIGEAQLQVWVADGGPFPTLMPGIDPQPAPGAEAAAGWGGDRLASYEGPDDAWAIVWQTVWDTPEDASEFEVAAIDAMTDLPGVHEVTRGSLTDDAAEGVVVVIADSQTTLDRLEALLVAD